MHLDSFVVSFPLSLSCLLLPALVVTTKSERKSGPHFPVAFSVLTCFVIRLIWSIAVSPMYVLLQFNVVDLAAPGDLQIAEVEDREEGEDDLDLYMIICNFLLINLFVSHDRI